MQRRAVISTVLAGALCALVACGGSLSKPPSLLTEARGYNDGVRWSQPEKSALRVPPELRSDFVADREQFLDDLRVGDYEIKSIRYRDARTAARIDVRYTWHLDSRGVVHKTTSRQTWERRGKNWMMVAEERLRGEPMPGLSEPDDDEGVDEPGETEPDLVGVGDDADGAAPDRSKPPKSQVVFDSGPVPR